MIGAGAVPVLELFANTGLAMDNGITVNEFLETNVAGVCAAGDVANYPDKIFEKRRRVEHWDNAVSQGQHWARAVSGERKAFVHVPYFFSDVFDLSYEIWGDSAGATQTVVRGDLESAKFSVWWLKEKRVIAAFAMNRPDEEKKVIPEWIERRQNVLASVLGDEGKEMEKAIG